jgi:hypothetical protein
MTTATGWRPVLGAALAAHELDELAAQTVEVLARESPEVHADPDLRDLARRSAAANIELVAAVVRGEADLRVRSPSQAVAYARELARRNVPMGELARAYRIGQRVMWRFGVAELREAIDDPAEVAGAIESYTDATFATGEVLMGGALERYAAERDRWVRSADALRRATVQELLEGGAVDVAAASGRLRYELRRAHTAFVVWAEADDALLESAAVAVGGPSALVVPLGNGLVAGWCPPDEADPAAAPEALVAFGLPAEGLTGFRASHGQAMEARRVARLGGLPSPVGYEDVALTALLTHDLEQAHAFAERELGALADAEAARLAATVLEVLVHQGSPRRAAQRLGLHENTVAKRARAAEELLGRPIDARPVETLAALLILRAVRRDAHA